MKGCKSDSTEQSGVGNGHCWGPLDSGGILDQTQIQIQKAKLGSLVPMDSEGEICEILLTVFWQLFQVQHTMLYSCLRNFHVIHTLFWCTNVWNSVVQKPIWENSWKTAKLIADKGSWGVDWEVLLPGFGLDNRLPALSTLGTTNTFCYFDKYIFVFE